MPTQVWLCQYCKKTRAKGMLELYKHHMKVHPKLPWPQLAPKKEATDDNLPKMQQS